MTDDLTRRSDLVCQGCGKVYEGPVDSVECSICEAKDDRPPVERAIANPPEAPEQGPYKKVVKVDKDRQRVELGGRQKKTEDVSKARVKAMDAIAKEPAADAKKKEPLRSRLEELKEKRDKKREEVAKIEEEILDVMMKLDPGADLATPATKKCFGRHDEGDYECRHVCPLRLECAEKSAASPIEEKVAVGSSARPDRK